MQTNLCLGKSFAFLFSPFSVLCSHPFHHPLLPFNTLFFTWSNAILHGATVSELLISTKLMERQEFSIFLPVLLQLHCFPCHRSIIISMQLSFPERNAVPNGGSVVNKLILTGYTTVYFILFKGSLCQEVQGTMCLLKKVEKRVKALKLSCILHLIEVRKNLQGKWRMVRYGGSVPHAIQSQQQRWIEIGPGLCCLNNTLD